MKKVDFGGIASPASAIARTASNGGGASRNAAPAAPLADQLRRLVGVMHVAGLYAAEQPAHHEPLEHRDVEIAPHRGPVGRHRVGLGGLVRDGQPVGAILRRATRTFARPRADARARTRALRDPSHPSARRRTHPPSVKGSRPPSDRRRGGSATAPGPHHAASTRYMSIASHGPWAVGRAALPPVLLRGAVTVMPVCDDDDGARERAT